MTAFASKLAADLEALWRRHAGEAGWPGAIVEASIGGAAVFTWGAGRTRRDSAAPMNARSGFHIASVGKMFTAVLLHQLQEEERLGRLGLDAPLSAFDEISDILAHAPCLRHDGVTLRRMLNHSSGLRDAFSDDGAALATQIGRPAPLSLSAHFRANPPRDPGNGRAWPAWDGSRLGDSHAGVLNWFIWGGRAASALACAPGDQFHYSDTAYMILALLAERVAGQSYEALCAERIFSPIGMRQTYLAYGEAAPDGWRARVADFSYSGQAVFSEGLDASWDWGGGGQISTVGDIAIFLRALSAGRLFRKPETLGEMTAWRVLQRLPSGCAGMGAGVRLLRSPRGVELVGHAGAWGVQAFYAPALDGVIAGTFNQPMALDERLRTWVFDVADAVFAPRA